MVEGSQEGSTEVRNAAELHTHKQVSLGVNTDITATSALNLQQSKVSLPQIHRKGGLAGEFWDLVVGFVPFFFIRGRKQHIIATEVIGDSLLQTRLKPRQCSAGVTVADPSTPTVLCGLMFALS